MNTDTTNRNPYSANQELLELLVMNPELIKFLKKMKIGMSTSKNILDNVLGVFYDGGYRPIISELGHDGKDVNGSELMEFIAEVINREPSYGIHLDIDDLMEMLKNSIDSIVYSDSKYCIDEFPSKSLLGMDIRKLDDLFESDRIDVNRIMEKLHDCFKRIDDEINGHESTYDRSYSVDSRMEENNTNGNNLHRLKFLISTYYINRMINHHLRSGKVFLMNQSLLFKAAVQYFTEKICNEYGMVSSNDERTPYLIAMPDGKSSHVVPDCVIRNKRKTLLTMNVTCTRYARRTSYNNVYKLQTYIEATDADDGLLVYPWSEPMEKTIVLNNGRPSFIFLRILHIEEDLRKTFEEMQL